MTNSQNKDTYIHSSFREKQGKTESEMKSSGAMQWSNQSPRITQKRFSWYGHVMRREDTNVYKDEGGREETSMKAQTEVDGPSAERFETTPFRYKARTEPRSMQSTPERDMIGKG